MKSVFRFLPAFVLFISCSDQEMEDPQMEASANYEFYDGFETAGFDLAELFDAEGLRWSNLQIVDSENGINTVELSSERYSEGGQSLYCMAVSSGNVVSKANAEKNGFSAQRGDRVSVKADFFLPENESFSNVLLMDLECCSCWDPAVPDNQCPGVRLMFDTNGEYLQMERGKIGLATAAQYSVSFPRNEWVTVEWLMTLSDEAGGLNKILINGEEALSTEGINMPNQLVFDSLFAEVGMNFELQEPLAYERLQIGATANPSPDTARIWVDAVRFTIDH